MTEKEICKKENIKTIERLNGFSFEPDRDYICEKGKRHYPAPQFSFKTRKSEPGMVTAYETLYQDNMCYGCTKCYTKEKQRELLYEDFFQRKLSVYNEADKRIKELQKEYVEKALELE